MITGQGTELVTQGSSGEDPHLIGYA